MNTSHNEKLDTETKKILTDAEKLRLLTEHDGWGIARAKLIELVQELSDIRNVDISDPQKLIISIQANKTATEILLRWMKDIESTPGQVTENTSLSGSRESYIVRQ